MASRVRGCGARIPLAVDPEGAAPASRRGRYAPVVGRLQAVGVTGQRAVARRRRPLCHRGGPAFPASADTPGSSSRSGAAAARRPDSDNHPRTGHEGRHQAAMRSLSQPPSQLPQHGGQHGAGSTASSGQCCSMRRSPEMRADHPQLAMEQIVQQLVVAAQAVVAPEPPGCAARSG